MRHACVGPESGVTTTAVAASADSEVALFFEQPTPTPEAVTMNQGEGAAETKIKRNTRKHEAHIRLREPLMSWSSTTRPANLFRPAFFQGDHYEVSFCISDRRHRRRRSCLVGWRCPGIKPSRSSLRSKNPKVDASDFYMFQSYTANSTTGVALAADGTSNYTTIIANYERSRIRPAARTSSRSTRRLSTRSTSTTPVTALKT